MPKQNCSYKETQRHVKFVYFEKLHKLSQCLKYSHTFNGAKDERRGKPVCASSLSSMFLLDQAICASTYHKERIKRLPMT